MGFRFSKSINLGAGVRLNLSKKGLGISAGVKGARVGIGPHGIKKTLSIPGTGISYSTEKKFKNANTSPANSDNQRGFSTGSAISASMIENETESNNSQVSGKVPRRNIWLMGSITGLIILIGNPILGLIISSGCGFMFYKSLKAT